VHVHALDSYRPGDSPLHRLDPRVKLVLTILLALAVALVPDGRWAVFGVVALLLWGATALSSVGWALVQQRSLVALPFALAALTVLFSTPGRELATFDLPGGPWTITAAGVARFLSIVVRSYLSVQAAVLLAATTPFPDLLWGMRALHVPEVLVTIAGFLYRYLFVLVDEAQRMLRARSARSATRQGGGGGSLAWRARVTGSMAGSLFIRSYERSERIYAAMLARGYDGEPRTLSPPSLRPSDLLAGGGVALFLLVVVLLSRAGGA
jgi:cobalt/nickel transport system permease protein